MTNELKVILGIGVVTLVLFIGAVIVLGNGGSDERQSNVVVKTEGALHRKGNENAPVTIVEFADFQCPSCARMHPILQKLFAENDGKVQLIYRHFPLPQHLNAIDAINAAEAANGQGKFWEMHATLYEKQAEWSESSRAEELFINYAKTLGLDTNTFTKDFGSKAYEQIIQTDSSDGIKLGVNSTPTIFVNNTKVAVGDYNYEGLKKMIDKALQ